MFYIMFCSELYSKEPLLEISTHKTENSMSMENECLNYAEAEVHLLFFFISYINL